LRTGKQQWRNAVNKNIQSVLQRTRRRYGCSHGRSGPHQESLLYELRDLRRRIAAVESERNAARRQLEALERALLQTGTRPPVPAPKNEGHPVSTERTPRRGLRTLPLGLTASVLLLGALASASTLLDKPGAAPAQPPSERLAETAREDMASMETTSVAESSTPTVEPIRPESLRASIRELGHRSARASGPSPEHRQWGPALYLPDPKGKKRLIRATDFDPRVKQQQQDLLDLGFDLGQSSADGLKGPRTQQALDEFRSLYLAPGDPQQSLDDAALAFLITVYADLARQDAEKFNVDRGVVAGIRLSSVRTGVEFSFLMELAAVESAFNPVAQAPGSSAAGLYQFTHDTWLNTVKAHGEKYGLGDYASQIEYTVDRRGNRRPRIKNKRVYQHLLELRRNPRVSAIMAAESVKDNLRKLSSHFDHQPGRTELYLTHFLGPRGAVSFIKALKKNPDSFAAEMFPTAAKNNASIFHPKTCEPRTVNEVYEVFSRKFDTARYEDWDVN
jgi:peptidoglycan hydrolase-like protein with peptidoglycan-binding domain